MFLTVVSSAQKRTATIQKVTNADYKRITKKEYFFNWRLEKLYDVYKLTIENDEAILGLISVDRFDSEYRIDIRLLSVSVEHFGTKKKIDRIAGNLIAFAGRLAIARYGKLAAISLTPKTTLGQHYMNKYGFEQAGKNLFMIWGGIQKLLKEYDYD